MSIVAKVRKVLRLKSSMHPNERIRKELRSRGDFGRNSRLVCHTARFGTESQAAAFKTFVTFRGYEVVDAAHSNVVLFQRVSKMVGKQFDAETDLLRNEIENLHGDYEGFGNGSLR